MFIRYRECAVIKEIEVVKTTNLEMGIDVVRRNRKQAPKIVTSIFWNDIQHALDRMTAGRTYGLYTWLAAQH